MKPEQKHNFFILYAADGKIKMIEANLIKTER